MLRRLYRLLMLSVLFSGPAHAGITDGLVEWLAQDSDLSGVRQVEFHTVVDNTGKQFEFDAAAAATEALRQRLTQSGMILVDSGNSSPQHIVIKSSLVYYKPGSVGGRWVGLGGGSAVCILRTMLFDSRSNRLLGDLTGAYQVVVGGLFTIGADEKVLVVAAELIANRILELAELESVDNEID